MLKSLLKFASFWFVLCTIVIMSAASLFTFAANIMNQSNDAAVMLGLLIMVVVTIAVAWFMYYFFRSGRNLIKKHFTALIVLMATQLVGCAGCERIDAGNVGIKISMAGSNRGVQDVPIVTGWVFYNPFSEKVLEYPTYVQTATWQRASAENSGEELSFNSTEGLNITGDISVSYQIEPSKVPAFYVKFRSDDLEKFTHGFLRNVARDQFNEVAGTFPVEDLYGPKKELFVQTVKKRINEQLKSIGVSIEQLGFVGAPRLPQAVIERINAKIAATQQAIQVENELRTANAQAAKDVAQAEGAARAKIAKAEGDAKARVVQAESEAAANRAITGSITPVLLEWKRMENNRAAIDRWDGKRPQIEGANSPGLLMSLPADQR